MRESKRSVLVSRSTMAHATAAFDKNVEKIIEEWKVPGLGVAIVQGEQIHAKVCLANISPKLC